MESRDLRTLGIIAVKSVRRSFDSLCSLRMTYPIQLNNRYLVGGGMTPPYAYIDMLRIKIPTAYAVGVLVYCRLARV